jgi:hypothetical protein
VTALLYSLLRHRDPSNVSGTGTVATIVEFDDGQAVLHWDSEKPSTTVYTDFRHIEELHGHEGASELVLHDSSRADRLLTAYQRVVPWVLSAHYHDRPVSCAPHPDHPDRLLLTFRDERVWAFWVALLDGSTYAASHVEVKGQIVTTWVSPDGNVWLQYATAGTFTDLLEGEKYGAYPDHDAHDPRD